MNFRAEAFWSLCYQTQSLGMRLYGSHMYICI